MHRVKMRGLYYCDELEVPGLTTLKIKWLRELVRKAYFYCIPFQTGRTAFLEKHDVFDCMGENCFFQPRKLPNDPKCIRLHNNVVIAADVTFVNHDVIYLMLRNVCCRKQI